MRTTLLRHALTDSRTGLPNTLALEAFEERFRPISERHELELRLLRLRFSDADALETGLGRLLPQIREADLLARTGDTELSLLVIVPAPEAVEAARRRIAGLMSACPAVEISVERPRADHPDRPEHSE